MSEKSLSGKLFRGTMIIIFVSILGKLSSFLTEAVLANYFGTSAQGDAFYMVTSIQYVIYPMLSVGIWNVFLPIYKDKLTTGAKKEADSLANRVITTFTIVSVIAVVLLFLLSDGVVAIMAPGFENETKALCAKLVRISSPMYVFILASAVYAAILQCHDRFFGSQIREVASHIPIIVTAIIFYPKFGINSLAVALIFGGCLRLLIQLPFINWNYRFRPSFKKSEEYTLLRKRFPPALIGAGVKQVNPVIDKMMASHLAEGSVSGLNYGVRLTNVFSGLLSSAVGTAMYPQIVELVALKKRKELSNMMAKLVRIFGALMIPITFACILFREEIVSVAFQRGSFGEASVALTAGTFACYSIGLFFTACNTVLENVFYGSGDTKTAMYLSIASMLINVGLNLTLMYFFGINGLALATSLSAIIVFAIRGKLLGKYVDMKWFHIVIKLGKVLLASAIACGISKWLICVISLNRYVELLLACATGVAIYSIECHFFRIDELKELMNLFFRRLKKKDTGVKQE